MQIYSNVIVFDLDDTLYSEFSYQSSGVEEILVILNKLYGVNKEKFRAIYEKNKDCDFLKLFAQEIGFPELKESLLWIYRLHHPKIFLIDSAKEVLDYFSSLNCPVVILSDGRSITQRLKIKSLGLENYPVYLSEDFGSDKLDDLRFLKIESTYKAKKYFYIGDNPAKDFFIPNQLGWETIMIKANFKTVHPQSLMQDKKFNPKFTIRNILECKKIIHSL